MAKNYVVCHAIDDPPKSIPPNHLQQAIFVVVDGPSGPSTAATDGPPDYLQHHRWSPLATDGSQRKTLMCAIDAFSTCILKLIQGIAI